MSKYKTPKMGCENTISFTCSDDSVEKLVEQLLKLDS